MTAKIPQAQLIPSLAALTFSQQARPSQPPTWLPPEVLENIAKFIPDSDLKAFALVDKRTQCLALRERLFRVWNNVEKELAQVSISTSLNNEASLPIFRTYSEFLQNVLIHQQHLQQPLILTTQKELNDLDQSLIQNAINYLAEVKRNDQSSLLIQIDRNHVDLDFIDQFELKLQETVISKAIIQIIEASPNRPYQELLKDYAFRLGATKGHLYAVQHFLRFSRISNKAKQDALYGASLNRHQAIVNCLQNHMLPWQR